MLSKTTRSSGSWLAVPVLVAVAFGLGVLASPLFERDGRGRRSAGATPPSSPAKVVQVGELPLLQLAVRDADWQVLSNQRERAIEAGIIVQDANAIVPAAVRYGEQSSTGTVRIKGDWLDHVDSDRWSLRFELEQPLLGMRNFSVQHPKTRGYILEWLVMKTARHMGVLAPRVEFVKLAINGREPQIYYLEEHASKELLESQGRRDGPIVKFDESAMWGTWLQHGFHQGDALPPEVVRATTVFDVEARAFGEGRLRKVDAVNTRLMRALQQARDLQRLAVVDGLEQQPARSLAALRALEGRTIEELFAVDALAKWLALQALFGAHHGLVWHQWRFCHDPVLDRLEPIAFDTGATLPFEPLEKFLAADELSLFRSSDRLMAAVYRELGHMTEPTWVESLLADLSQQSAVREVAKTAPGLDVDLLLNVVLKQRIAEVRSLVRPEHAAGFDARVVGVRQQGGEDLRAVEVQAWARTEIPTRLSGLRFSNGRVVLPATAITDESSRVSALPDGSVLLPRDGSRVVLRFPIDQRLAGLGEIAAIKRAIRAMVEPQKDVSIAMSVAYRTVGETVDRTQDLVMRRSSSAAEPQHGRPPAPALADCLAAHAFLRYDLATDRVHVRSGHHDVDGDLHLPDNRLLVLDAGAQLRFDADATMVVGALLAQGDAEHPVRLAAKKEQAGFAGVLVLGTAGPSDLRFLHVSHARSIERGGWQATGGITFVGAPVTLRDCSFVGAMGEDSLNLVRVRFLMERCTFDGGASDLFDGDFVTGQVVQCTFKNSVEDAIDVSGSNVDVRDCTFVAIGDKALSVGESSRMRASGCHVLDAAIAVASKDRSEATIEGLVVDEVAHFVGAAYIKKLEFGAATIRLTGLQFGGQGEPAFLAQTGCGIQVDGVAIATKDVDVDQLYRDKVLGK